MFRLKLRILLIIVIFISIENLYAEGGDSQKPEAKKKESVNIAPEKIISKLPVEIPKKPEIIEVPKNPAPVEANQEDECKVDPDHDGYYKLRESISLIRPGGKIETTLRASPSKPKIVYVEDLEENEGPGKWAIKIKVFDNEHKQALPENGGFLYVSCKYFYQQVKKSKETPEEYEERKRTTHPEEYDFPEEFKDDTDTPTEDDKGLLAAIEEMIKKAQNYSWTTQESCIDDKTNSTTKKNEEIIPIKTKEEANKYFECYRRTETSQDEYKKKYQPVIESISNVAQRLLSDNEKDDAQNKNDFEIILSCLIFRESDHWTGKTNKNSGAVGFGQFTSHGIDKVRNILQRISNYKPIDYKKEEAKIQKTYDEAYDKKNAERELKDDDSEKKKEELSVLKKKQGRTKQENMEMDKLDKEISALKGEIRKIDRELVKLDDENEKNKSVNREKALKAVSTNKLKVVWDAFWENYKGKHKKPDLEKIDWKNPPSSLMASKEFLKKKENYEISFLYTALTLLDDFQDLKLSTDSICRDKNLTGDQKPTNVETLIGATGMYNLGPNGFMTKALTFKDSKTGKKDWSVRLDDQLTNLKKSGYFQRVEGVNHMLSVKRCAEAGKNQPPCDISIEKPIPNPDCNWAMPDSPPNRSMCENKLIHLCVRGKTRNYECPTKK